MKGWVILQEKLSPIIHVTSNSVLREDHGFDKIEIKVEVIELLKNSTPQVNSWWSPAISSFTATFTRLGP